MYNETCLEVCRIENGYLIEVRIPYKEDSDGCCVEPSRNKTFSVKTAEEAAEKIKEILPLLADKVEAEEEFNKVFEELSS
jgi:hypothetical protein